jgi:hypothetical protein
MNSNKIFKEDQHHKKPQSWREGGWRLLGDVNIIDVTSTNEGTHPNRSTFQF